VYVQPGGDAYSQQNSIGDTGKANILKYIESKRGIYLGTCAGWFFASDGYYWEGVKYDWPNLLGKFPTTEGSIHEIATYPNYAMTDTSSGESSKAHSQLRTVSPTAWIHAITDLCSH
jgi:hypothetical protein